MEVKANASARPPQELGSRRAAEQRARTAREQGGDRVRSLPHATGRLSLGEMGFSGGFPTEEAPDLTYIFKVSLWFLC